ncbi:hypothetical protein TW84_23220 [Vibrio neptunius]|uniref:SMI1/KNR4 family protein n=1 Tax=Vibrio neptunius TaxID=170651 RepID=UPI0005FA8A7B|nr:SMI1/KNR4 family protein [Vibrio neptunius]KJY82093.1 hypothetical protein TW84_23220 [Vibrio neptunius]
MLVENKSYKAFFYGNAQNIPKQNSKISSMWFAKNDQPFDHISIEKELNIQFPELFLNFLKECGGFYFDHSCNYSYPCAPDDMNKSLSISFDIVDNKRSRNITFVLFDGFFLPGSAAYNSEKKILDECFSSGEYDQELCGRDWSKLIPFANDNGDLLCLDFNVKDEPEVVYITYDGVDIFPALTNFEHLLIGLDY